MTKELFVSSTPHETKVGMVEDDQLAEVYLERENEYTLAGSIYKGRVTRVLPGMQSAFVDIGLERDAFLYVSDFMELESPDEDLDEVPVAPVAQKAQAAAQSSAVAPVESHLEGEEQTLVAAQTVPTQTPPREERERGGWRGRRRRGGHRDRESRFSRSAQTEVRSGRDDYGPPPGYEPIILPGESISKYRDRGQAAAQAPSVAATTEEAPEALADAFPQDEPLFAEVAAEPGADSVDFGPAEGSSPVWEQEHKSNLGEMEEALPTAGVESKAETEFEMNNGGTEPALSDRPEGGRRMGVPARSSEFSEVGSDEWDRQQKRRHEMNVAAVFGGEETIEEEQPHPRTGISDSSSEPASAALSATPGTVEEEEIDEEEADIASYVEELEEDAAFDEFEEETHAAGDQPTQEIAASAENGANIVPFSPEPVAPQAAEVVQAEEELEEASEQDAEIEEAQAEAEALLDAEAIGNGTVDARAEVRAPAATAAYTQRARRFDRDRGRRGGFRRGGGGRRFRRTEPQNLPLITDLLKEGQEILVQIAKEPIGKKGARITSHIALPGRFLVYMPTVNHTGVSRKIASDEERLRLKRIIQSERENGNGGFIVRTAAQGAAEDELRADIRFLKGLWNEIRTRAENSKPPALIYHDLNVVERILRDQVTSDFSAIWVDTEQEYERILRFANRFQSGLVRRVKLYSKETPLFEQFGLKDEIDKALKSKVWLKSGGYIVINQTEALVAIDVNTGKYVGKTTRLEDTIVKTNVDAIKEIVRQIRLRDLGGIIVIDFIDMDERRNRQKVMQALEEALRADRSPSKVLQFNDFGLVAITRKRVKQSLERTIGSPCPYCEATGFVKNVNTVCNEIYVEMRKISKHLEHSDVMLRVNPEVAKALKINNGRWLNELEELSKKTIIVKSDPALHQEQFDIN
jgi:Rne/Rng family ribonuclease